MRKSFEEVLKLTEDEFSAYFNGLVADALGRGGAGAGAGAAAGTGGVLSQAEQKLIKKTCDNLYQRLKRDSCEPVLIASTESVYLKLETAHIEAAIAALQSDLDTAPAAAASAAPASGVLQHPSLGGLSDGPMRYLASYLSHKEGNRLALASRELHTVLKGGPTLLKFLLHVACGQQDEAAAMLSTDASLLTQAGEFTDYSGRRFSCTAYEYAYWAKDTHMCRMLETYMDEKAKAIIRKRIDNMEAIDPATRQARGLVYWQNGDQSQSAHFDFTPLIIAL